MPKRLFACVKEHELEHRCTYYGRILCTDDIKFEWYCDCRGGHRTPEAAKKCALRKMATHRVETGIYRYLGYTITRNTFTPVGCYGSWTVYRSPFGERINTDSMEACKAWIDGRITDIE